MSAPSLTAITRTPILELSGVRAGYGQLTVLRDIDLQVEPGQVVALLGPNGAGKTTLLRASSGLIRPTAGSIRLNGADVTRRTPYELARAGVCHVPEGRGIFPNLTVRENIYVLVDRRERGRALEIVTESFPMLSERLGQVAGTMSGGQQQMLAMARCYLGNPQVLLVDEVSMGLAPLVVDQIYQSISELRSRGTSIVLVEQFLERALEIADYVYILTRGSVVLKASPQGLDHDEVMRRYLGSQPGPVDDDARPPDGEAHDVNT
jgi:branched-chain amino acid transport system ATP-binding protein